MQGSEEMHHQHSFYFDVSRPQRLSRLLIFIKWLLIIPHALILWAYGILAGIAGFVGWWAVLFLGRFPEGLWGILYGFVRWNTRVSIYASLLRDEYPPFGEAPYPMDFHLQRPSQQSRLLVLARFLLIIPLAFWLGLVGIYAAILAFIAFFAILITGNIPEGIFRSMVGIMRYGLKVNLYSYVLTDEWPGFSID